MKPLRVRTFLIASLIGFMLTTAATPQDTMANPSPPDGTASGHAAETRLPDLLLQFNGLLQALATRASLAVVQVTVTGFGLT
jgi:hypothetical protein